jgi:hypothetical protein
MTIKLHEVGSAAETFAVLENRSNDNVRSGVSAMRTGD